MRLIFQDVVIHSFYVGYAEDRGLCYLGTIGSGDDPVTFSGSIPNKIELLRWHYIAQAIEGVKLTSLTLKSDDGVNFELVDYEL